MSDRLTVISGDCVEELRRLQAESVHLCVTSPPYWGLRDYKIPPSIWGGEPECEHEWNGVVRNKDSYQSGEKRKWQHDKGNGTHTRDAIGEWQPRTAQGSSCSHCNAWRGVFGLEPTPELYLAHTLIIFREVWRVLRKDGTLWINLGDSYATGGGAVGACPGGGAQGSRWAGQHPGRMKQNGLATNSGAGMGPIQQPNRMPQAGLKAGDLVGIPWRVALALQADGWFLRRDNIWFKPNPMPESVSGWRWEQHKVKISKSDYEERTRVREAIPADASLQSSSIEVSEKRQGSHRDSTPRATAENQSGPVGVCSLAGGETQPTTVRAKRQRKGNASSNCDALPQNSEGASTDASARSEAKSHPQFTQKTADNCQQGFAPDKPAMAVDSGSPKGSVLLVQTASEVNTGSCDSSEQGRDARGVERGGCLQAVQQQQGGKDTDFIVIDCPGCDKCAPNGGLILRKGNWRCTTSHEYVFQFSKSDSYFCDAEAARERGTSGTSDRRKMIEGNDRIGGKNKVSGDRLMRANSASRIGQKRAVGNAMNRNRRSVWIITTAPFKGAHFATFPPALVRPIIQAASPTKCCAKCGAPWAPVVERGKPRSEQQKACGGDQNGQYNGTATKDFLDAGAEDASAVKARILAGMVSKTVIGYRPTCKHVDEPSVPAVVLDPFGGSGTVGQVALEEGRAAVLIELSREYLPMIHKRCAVTHGLGV